MNKSSRGSGAKPDKLPHVMSLESASVGAEDYKFENFELVKFEAISSRLRHNYRHNTSKPLTQVLVVEVHCG